MKHAKLYIAGWAEFDRPAGNAGGASAPMPLDEAVAWLLGEISRNHRFWPDTTEVHDILRNATDPVGVETRWHRFYVQEA